MARRLSVLAVSCGVLVLLAHPALAWQTTRDSAAQKDSSYIDADGTAHITRVVPLPATVSPEAQKGLAHQVSDANPNQTLEQRRTETMPRQQLEPRQTAPCIQWISHRRPFPGYRFG